MRIAVRRGYQRTGEDLGAIGLLREVDIAEDYHIELMKQLRALGHEVLDVTPPEAHRSLTDSIDYGVDKANAWGADLYISCQTNNYYHRFNGALGSEVLYYKWSNKGKIYAENIEKHLVKIGFRSRGAKGDAKYLIELAKTEMPAIIIKAFFVEASEDVALWRSVGAKGVAEAIARGLK
ncbi:N-acetylmuramoyl-L-alanine amidase [Clostridium intestinale]|uniref:N-acetylmuramoyl-L-alanine amidase n=1 Tax=Clostridium intestinale DSM 6191 TaxID=1121320 RepID=A0A1M5WIQ8_9CLOT|nr:N-acetylmuramoyl-L-alanine amidase [Clostridium intestinale]SHH87396.1 N-acetylmuramoyl-L-alanine amidase [Clostridium intestinale DSM 6191]